jgi:hypothetical protein
MDLLGAANNTSPIGKQTAVGKVSYFLNGDATESDPQAILVGDCNIGAFGTTTLSAASTYTFNQTAIGGSRTVLAGQKLVGTAFAGAAGPFWSWTSDLHQKAGNLAITDGSVSQVSISGLHTAFQNSTNTVTNPIFNFPL